MTSSLCIDRGLSVLSAMAMASLDVCTTKYMYAAIASLGLLTLTFTVCYHIYLVRSPQMSRVEIDRQYSVWMKSTMNGPSGKSTTNNTRSTSTPPWFALLADYNATVRSGRNLYVWSYGASLFTLAGKLFNYAALFGIAWRNRRIPIWSVNQASPHYDLTKFFKLRMPVDWNHRITHVSSISHYSF